jgi:phosphatidate cytidylyltransferase
LNVAGADPVNPPNLLVPASAGNKLLLRVGSALVMVPLAIGTAYLGGHIFLAFWLIASLGVLWEWDTLVCAHDKNAVFAVGSAAIVGAAALWMIGRMIPALILLGLGFLGVAALSTKSRRTWCIAGLVYASALLLAPLVLRHDATLGFAAILFLFAVVWSTDTAAYLVGRTLRGPKMAPQISPNKTWSGAIAGAAAAVLGGFAISRLAGLDDLATPAALALLLSIAAQCGDLFESAIKRQFNVKDASGLIPGHGGLMDRLDGFIAASVVAAVIGIARGGLDAPGRGLLDW